MLLVFRRQKGRLVMVEPPCKALVGAVFEIDDRVLVTVELFAVEGISRAVHRRGIGNLRAAVDPGLVKFSKNGGRRSPVEAIAVIKYPKFHIIQELPLGKTF